MINVVVVYNPAFQALADVTVPPLRRYCARHGYDLTLHCGGFARRNGLYVFEKVQFVSHLLAAAEILWVLDLDALITNHTIRLEQFIDESHDIFITTDVNGINSGSYLIRNNGVTRAFLRNVILLEGKYDGEQPAMIELINAIDSPPCRILPQNTINSYLYSEYGMQRSHEEGNWQRGDLLLHLPGRTNERRIEIFTSPEITDHII